MSTFDHGEKWENHTGETRGRMCPTCPFRRGTGTVRPPGVEPEDAWAETETFDDFVCHTTDEDGTNPSCAGWHAWRNA